MSPKLTAEQRHEFMARFKSTGTIPEVTLRHLLRRAGFVGYRLNVRSLPGKPDIAYTRWRVAVFTDGEWWHGHPDFFQAGTKGEYWDAKIARNQKRDRAADAALVAGGWRVVRLWSRDVSREPQRAVTEVVAALDKAGHPFAHRSLQAHLDRRSA